jgi:hypothetical protein
VPDHPGALLSNSFSKLELHLNAALVKWAPVVSEIGMNFPDK